MNASYEDCQVFHCWAHSEETLSDDDLWLFDKVFWSVSTVSLLLGFMLGVCIVHYEWYGGDPQKRSLANRVMSNACIADTLALVCLVALVASVRSVY